MDFEAIDTETFSVTARRANRKLLASVAACKNKWKMASLDMDKASLKGLTYKELAAATGEKERLMCFALPLGSAAVLRRLPGFANYGEAKRCLQCFKPGTGAKDAPRAFSLKLKTMTRVFGPRGTDCD